MEIKNVTVKNDAGQTVKLQLKSPNAGVSQKSQRIHVKTWTDCVKDGIMTKKELFKFMAEKAIWDDSKELEQIAYMKEISELEKKLYVKNGRKTKLKKSEGKDIAVKIRQLRFKIRELIAERIGLESNTAEALADNARFDFLVSACTYYENGEKVYNTLEEYNEGTDSELAFGAASALAEMLYGVDQDSESKLPENKFLKRYGLVDDDLSLVNTEGHRVDLQGRKIDDQGNFVDDKGNKIDIDGNLLDEDGYYVESITVVDEKGKKINPDG